MTLLFACPHLAWGDVGPQNRPAGWGDWNGDPVLLLTLTAATWLYVRGLARLWSGGSLFSMKSADHVVSRGQAAAFALGVFALFAALVSPLDALGGQLAWAHMVQHMILMTVAAPLVVRGAPFLVCLWGTPHGARQDVARAWGGLRLRRLPWQWLRHPLLAWSLFAFTMWIWHLPPLYSAALRSPVVHDAQHLSFFGAACLFWRQLLDPLSRFRLHGSIAALYLFGTTLHATVLGVFMTLSPIAWYSDYEGATAWWGLTPLEDQQLAGLVMWMPGCLPYLVAAAGLLGCALREDRGQRSEIRAG